MVWTPKDTQENVADLDEKRVNTLQQPMPEDRNGEQINNSKWHIKLPV